VANNKIDKFIIKRAIGKMPIDKMTPDKMPVDKMTPHKMTVGCRNAD
jgi:hypothetical protein